MGSYFLQVNSILIRVQSILHDGVNLNNSIFSFAGISVAIGIGVTIARKIRRGHIQRNYGRLHGEIREEMEMRPFVTNDELGQDALNASNQTVTLNQTNSTGSDSTLNLPPSQTTSIENPGYKSFSSSARSSDSTEFNSSDATLTERRIDEPGPSGLNSANRFSTHSFEKPSPSVQPPVASPKQTQSSGLKRPVLQSAESPKSSDQALDTATPNEPTTSTPRPAVTPTPPPMTPPALNESARSTSRSLVDRVQHVLRQRNRRTVSASDPTRVQPKRNVKKRINYKE